ncbi:hypothetical protein ACOMHN_056666 [Nucella lapillus]
MELLKSGKEVYEGGRTNSKDNYTVQKKPVGFKRRGKQVYEEGYTNFEDIYSVQKKPQDFKPSQCEVHMGADSGDIRADSYDCLTDAEQYSVGYISDDEESDLSDSDIVGLVTSANQQLPPQVSESWGVPPCHKQLTKEYSTDGVSGPCPTPSEEAISKKPHTKPANDVVKESCQLLLTAITLSVEDLLQSGLPSARNITPSDLLDAARYITKDTSLMASLLSLVTDSLAVRTGPMRTTNSSSE